MIQLTVTKKVENANFVKEMAAWDENNRYMSRSTNFEQPLKYTTENLLNVYITEEQWEAIRKQVIEKF